MFEDEKLFKANVTEVPPDGIYTLYVAKKYEILVNISNITMPLSSIYSKLIN